MNLILIYHYVLSRVNLLMENCHLKNHSLPLNISPFHNKLYYMGHLNIHKYVKVVIIILLFSNNINLSFINNYLILYLWKNYQKDLLMLLKETKDTFLKIINNKRKKSKKIMKKTFGRRKMNFKNKVLHYGLKY